MSDNANFMDILNTPSGEIKAPVALPVGEYICVVDGQPAYTKVGVKQTDAVDFNLKPMQAMDSVNKDNLIAALDGKSLTEKKIRHRLFITNESAYRLVQFLRDHLGIDDEGGKKPPAQMISEAMGRQVVVTLGHRSSEDGTQVFQDVKGTAHV